MSEQHAAPADPREALRYTIKHLEHILPAQAPISDFVHHNTLHGFQHLSFPEALAAARKVTGAYGYQGSEEYRRYYREGRITRDDLTAVLADDEHFDTEAALIEGNHGLRLTMADLVIAALTNDIRAVTNCQLNWKIEEQAAVTRFADGVSYESRKRILSQGHQAECDAVSSLWHASLERLGLQHFLLHPEELTDLSPELAETLFGEHSEEAYESGSDLPLNHTLMRKVVARQLAELLNRVGDEMTLRGLLQQLSGHDILDEYRPALIRMVGAYLDQGLAAWHGTGRDRGFLHFWRQCAEDDLTWVFDDLPEWRDELEMLADDPLDVVLDELQRLGLPEEKWTRYVERLALELPGWSGMFLWRHNHPGYEGLKPERVEMMDYLAVRLVLERIYAQRLCRRLWRIEASLEMLRWYFRRRRSELYARYTLFTQRLPEYLSHAAQQLSEVYASGSDYEQWQQLADRIWIWKQSPASDTLQGHTVLRSGWRLFLLAQHLGLSGNEVRALSDEQLNALFSALDLNDETIGFLWLQAYERHYHEQVYNALTQNHGRGPWAERTARPDAQVVFCMDDREEGIRRHLEELNPNIETLGAAGFFGVAVNWRGLDDKTVTPLCPVVVRPSHEIREIPQAGSEELLSAHNKRRAWRLKLKNLIHQEMRQRLPDATLLMMATAPLALLTLASKVFAPRLTGNLLDDWRHHFDKQVPTRVAVNADHIHEASPEHPQIGFSDEEQAERVHGFLRSIGLQQGMGHFVVMMGHGSGSQNNPHMAAYDCGACSGRHGGPNARIFAAMANRPAIRHILAGRGLVIPEDTWVVGAEHNTCDEAIHWYDTDLVPESLQGKFKQLQDEIATATRQSAHERARRFASAPDTDKLNIDRAYRHSIARSMDFSQTRPELGHATNGFAFIGRRSATRGAFFDRRAFLISYDPTQDADGQVIEAILLAAGPVGAGINLEYYFSTVNNEGYGCGSKVTHNVSGMLGVMHGASDDLRTGLPQQMIEIHEAMRLLVVVEASTDTLTKIYMRQPPLQELVGNGWLLLAAKDPHSEAIDIFKPTRGWVRWEGELTELPTVKCSSEWYRGKRQPLAISLIEQQEVGHAS